ncbi:hypothetical protein [Shewanella sp. 10N.286.48.B5]|uniref:hypothetical protein n=1 Tax=Shewanella sp. 10N.286.48.B5 TaxID=1880834 RepID=UPI000C85DB5F|nr:hypothetical protein [Shewanella sp. 10N.286.48.B5]PMH84618.1 hypothetical protein BCU57_17280 [Shewanella sp. 10N.286.48.B5]
MGITAKNHSRVKLTGVALATLLALCGCQSTTSVISAKKDLDISVTQNTGRCVTDNNANIGSLSVFTANTLSGYIVDNKFDQYAKAHIQQYQTDIVIKDIYQSEDASWSQLCVSTQLDMTFTDKADASKTLTLPLYLSLDKGSPVLEIHSNKTDIESVKASVFQNNARPGKATLVMKWVTQWREDNQGKELQLWNGELLSFTFDDKGQISVDGQSGQPYVTFPMPSYSMVNNQPSQSVQKLTFTLTVVNDQAE